MSKQVGTYTHTTLQMEAALCIWEDLLERKDSHDNNALDCYPNETAEAFGKALYDYWERMGTVEMRHTAINMSARAVEDFAALEAAIGRDEIFETWGSYDWDWIPAWVYAAVDLSSGHPVLRDSGTVVQGMIREHYSSALTVAAWKEAVGFNKTQLGFDQWRDQQVWESMKQGHVGV